MYICLLACWGNVVTLCGNANLSSLLNQITLTSVQVALLAKMTSLFSLWLLRATPIILVSQSVFPLRINIECVYMLRLVILNTVPFLHLLFALSCKVRHSIPGVSILCNSYNLLTQQNYVFLRPIPQLQVVCTLR